MGTFIASVLSSAVGVSIAITNSTLHATRYAASVVGATFTDVEIVVNDSTLDIAGGDEVGAVALAASTVVRAAISVTASSVTCIAMLLQAAIAAAASACYRARRASLRKPPLCTSPPSVTTVPTSPLSRRAHSAMAAAA